MNTTCQSHKPCSCALATTELFEKLRDLLDINTEHAKTGKLTFGAREIRETIEAAQEALRVVGPSCGIDTEHVKYFLDNAMEHYESGLRKGDMHSLAEAAEIAAEAELPLLRELWAGQEKEAG
ncbi:hypothetical protein ES705_20833 [subsurface metagenome]